MKNARILILEDDPLWQDTLLDVFAEKVAWVKGVTTLAEALEALDRWYFNIAIVDISLEVGDPKDSQGMAFMRALRDRGLHEAVRCVVLTAYGDVERTREAFHDHRVIDFIEKVSFTAEALTEKITEALAANSLRHDLQVDVAQRHSLDEFLADLQWARREPADQLRAELDDLLVRSFPEADHLFIAPMSTGQSGALVWRVEPTYGLRSGVPVVLKCGKKGKIEHESANYTEYVERYVGAYCTTRVRCVLGRTMGAIIYQLIGTDLNKVESFAQYYRQHTAPEVNNVLDHLFLDTCGRCYENLEPPRRSRDFVELYEKGLHIQWDEVWQGMAALGVDPDLDPMTIPDMPGSFTNPRCWLAARNHALYERCWLAATHGDLNEHNILVTADGHCWLIDFYRTGLGHVLRDIVELETALKFSLTTASLAEQALIEALLLQQQRIDAPIAPPPDHPHAKLLSVIAHLRSQAARLVGADRDMREYNTALLLTTLNLLRLPALRSSHARALLSAALLCQALS